MSERPLDFCKLFTTKDRGQMLVKIDRDDESGNPEVRVYARPEPLGVCSVAFSWNDDTDESWDRAEEVFEKFSEEDARTATTVMFDMAKEADGE